MAKFNPGFSRRGLLKASAVAGVGLAAPTVFSSKAYAYTNEPKGGTVTLGFNVRMLTRALTSCALMNSRSNTSMVAAMAGC